jgi:hypothetical protein
MTCIRTYIHMSWSISDNACEPGVASCSDTQCNSKYVCMYACTQAHASSCKLMCVCIRIHPHIHVPWSISDIACEPGVASCSDTQCKSKYVYMYACKHASSCVHVYMCIPHEAFLTMHANQALQAAATLSANHRLASATRAPTWTTATHRAPTSRRPRLSVYRSTPPSAWQSSASASALSAAPTLAVRTPTSSRLRSRTRCSSTPQVCDFMGFVCTFVHFYVCAHVHLHTYVYSNTHTQVPWC